MLKDAYVMKGVSHENVNCVLMTCLDQPPLLIYSDVTGAGFNLKKFLQHCKMSEVGCLLTYITKHTQICLVSYAIFLSPV